MRNSFLITLLAVVSTFFFGNQSYQHHKFMSAISNSWCGNSSSFDFPVQSFYHCNACNWFVLSLILTIIGASFVLRLQPSVKLYSITMPKIDARNSE